MDNKKLFLKTQKDYDYCTQNANQKFKIRTTEQLLNLMNVYYAEWSHRDEILWKQTYLFFFAAFIITIFPFVKIWDVSLPKSIPTSIFPIIGIVISIAGLWITIQYAKRLNKSSQTYRKLIKQLPKQFQREEIYVKKSFKNIKLAYVIPIGIYSALIIFAVFITLLCIID